MTTNDERRVIPSPDLSRDAIDAWLRAHGYRLEASVSRTHHRYRALQWRADGDAEVTLIENHMLGERVVIVCGGASTELEAALGAQPRAALLAAADAAVGRAVLAPLRRLCLLEGGAPSDELKALLVRARRDGDVLLRRALISAVVLSWNPKHFAWFVETGRESEQDERLAQLYAQIAASATAP